MNKILENIEDQYEMDFAIDVQKTVSGIEMGVLENGIPFLTQGGLADMCGVARSVIYDISREWEAAQEKGIFPKGRLAWLKDRLEEKEYNADKLYIETTSEGTSHYAYPDVVCSVLIEYYAFEAAEQRKVAQDHYRKMAQFGFNQFIYRALNYHQVDSWKYYHDRVSLTSNAAPDGYFSVFNEIAGLTVDLIEGGLTVSDKTIPDISVGKCWARYWKDNNWEKKYGPSVNYQHNYPNYYPQSASNPQSVAAYPEEALPEFRNWFRTVYLQTRFPKYILGKANILPGGKNEANQIAQKFKPAKLGRN